MSMTINEGPSESSRDRSVNNWSLKNESLAPGAEGREFAQFFESAVFDSTPVTNFGEISEIREATRTQIEAEPELHMCSLKFSRQHGGDLARVAIEHLERRLAPADFERLRIDSKVHTLKSGQLPAIPGWHCDFVTRDSKLRICPDVSLDQRVRHFLVVSGPPETVFLGGRKGVVLQKRPEHWGEVSRYVESLVRAGTLKTFSVPAGRVICFSAGRLHRGARMNLPEGQVHSRFFFRASLFPEDHPASAGPTEGKVRHHQQVYRIFPQDTFLPFVEAEGMAPEIISSEIIKGAIRKYSPQDLELEPRLNGCDLDFALQRGGSLTKELLTQILPTFSNIRRDTARVHTSTHMLSRGWLPGKLPGWNQMEEYEGSGLSGEQLVLTVNGREVQYRNSVGQVVDLPHGELLRCSLNEPLLFRPSLHTPGFEWSFRLRISCLGESERGWPTLPDNFCGKQHLVCIPEGGWW